MRGFVLTIAAVVAAVLIVAGVTLVVGLGVFAAVHYDGAAAACNDAQCCPGGQCRPGGTHPTVCPGGQCYPPNGSTGSYEFGDAQSGSVNERALTEPKSGPSCSTCPNRRPILQPAPINPSPVVVVPSSTLAKSKPNAIDGKREGAFQCDRCKRPTVGEQWQEIWADDDTPLTCVCRSCWDAMRPTERKSSLEAFAKRTSLSKSQSFYVGEMIAELTSR